MITVFHGDNTILSRKAFLEAVESSKIKGIDVFRVEGKDLNKTAFIQLLEAGSLFAEEKEIFFENLFSLPRSKWKEEMFNLLGNYKNIKIYIWEGKEIPKPTQEGLSSFFSFKPFKLSSTLFFFLNNLKPGEIKNNLNNLHACLKNEDQEMIFAMLIRQIRLLILAFDGENFLTGPSWQKARLIGQAKLFNISKLKSLYKKLLEIDYRQKTSQLPFDLSYSLDLLITEI